MTYRRSEVLTLPVRRRYERIELDPDLAKTLMPTEIKPGISVATVTGALVTKDNHHILKVCSFLVGKIFYKKVTCHVYVSQ